MQSGCEHAQFMSVPICFMSAALQEVLGLFVLSLFAGGLAWPLELGVLGLVPPPSLVPCNHNQGLPACASWGG